MPRKSLPYHRFRLFLPPFPMPPYDKPSNNVPPKKRGASLKSEVSKRGWRTEGVGARKSLPYHRFSAFFCTLFPMPPFMIRRSQFWGTNFAVFWVLLPLPANPFSKPLILGVDDKGIHAGQSRLKCNFGVSRMGAPESGQNNKCRPIQRNMISHMFFYEGEMFLRKCQINIISHIFFVKGNCLNARSSLKLFSGYL